MVSSEVAGVPLVSTNCREMVAVLSPVLVKYLSASKVVPVTVISSVSTLSAARACSS